MGTLQPADFAALLRRFRRASGLTQAELAERAGLSSEAVSALERGVNRAPRRETVDLLASALSLDPPNRAVFEQSARRRPTASAASFTADLPATAPLVGRMLERDLMGRLLGDRFPAMLLFEGEPGVGKTRLLREAAMLATGGGWTVLMGSCPRAKYHDPYAPMLGMIERDIAGRPSASLKSALDGCGWLVRLLPELAERELVPMPAWTLAPEQERRLMFAAVARYLSNIAGSAGTLVIVDDLQWAGADVTDLLAALARTPATTPLRIIGALTSSEMPADGSVAVALDDLEHQEVLHRQPVDRLGDEESAALLDELLPTDGASDPVSRERILAQCGGIPFFLVSWAQALGSGTSPAGDDPASPWDVYQSIRRRIAVQSEATVDALRVLAVAGGKASVRLLRAVLLTSGQSEDTIITALEAALRARLIDDVGNEGNDSYQFAQHVVGEVVAHDLSAARRTALHRRIAEALEREPGEPQPEMLAYHFLRGDEPARALGYLERAGDRAVAMQAYAAAETPYAELVAQLESLQRPREATHAREKWGTVLCVLARYDQSLAALERAHEFYVHEAEAESQMRVLAAIGQVYANRGASREGLARLAPAIASEREHSVAPQTLAALHDVYAQLLHLAGQYQEQLAATDRAADFARDAGDDLLRCQIQMRRGSAQRMLGRFGEASATLEDVILVAERIGDPLILSQALENVSVVYLLQGEFARSTRYVERALALVEQLADPLASELLLLRRGLNSYAMGHWRQAREDYEQAQRLAGEVGTSWVSAYIALGSGQLHLTEGNQEQGSQLLEDAVALATANGDLQALRWAETALAERDLLAGKPTPAQQRLQPLLDRPGQQEGLVTYLLPYLAWASLDLGDDAMASDYLDECLRRATSEHIWLAQVDALRVRAIQATRYGEYDAAEQALAEGLALSREIPYPYAEAKLLYVGGLLAQARGEPTLARQRLREANKALKALGDGLYRPQVERALAKLP